MSIVDELLSEPAVIAAGEYTYKGEIATYKGDMNAELADIMAVMCHATTTNVAMESDMLATRSGHPQAAAARGWSLRGPKYSLCVVADVFCVLRNDPGAFNEIAALMRQRLADRSMESV